MIICSASNIDLVQGQGTVGYGNADGTTDWRITNTPSATVGQTGTFNIFNSVTPTIPNISILETGTVGIGTVPSFSSAAKMEIIGDVNITGAYNINNRNAINDTSNYVLATSNILINRINASSGGGAITSGGNLTLTNNATSNTILSISNSNVNVVGPTPVITPTNTSGGVFSVGQITTTANSTDRFMIFTAGTSAFTVPTGGIVCDILMIGGGGAGGYGGNTGPYGGGGGGGAGACIVALNQPLTAGVSISIIVGNGDGQGTANAGTGGDSSISVGGTVRYLAKGGGRGERDVNGRNAGGCGGGTGGSVVKTGGLAVNTNMVNGTIVDANARSSTFAVFGNKGGDQQDGGLESAGGGGIGGVGGNHLSGNVNAGPGGVGLFQATVGGTTYNFRSYFANNGSAVSFGALNSADGNYYIGGGGGGSVYTTTHATGPNVGGIGGVGGGGNGGIRVRLNPDGTNLGAQDATSATANTGSGGGGGYYSDRPAGSGGSGIVIVRYRIAPPIVGVPFLELIRGTSSDSNTDYKLGNYNGDFKIVSSVANTDADRINITSTGNVGIGTSSPANELHIFDSTTSATSLIIQNNNMIMTSNTTQGTSTVTSTGAPVTSYSDGSFADNKPSVHEQVTSSTDRIMIFRAAGVNHTFTIPAGGLTCDILMIGGGGNGCLQGAGGGAGACIVAINHTLPAGSCVVNVGDGSFATSISTNGSDSYITIGGAERYRAKGGGSGSITNNSAGRDGGCGSGASYNHDTTADAGGAAVSTNVLNGSTAGPGVGSTHAVMGNAGGNNGTDTYITGSGGGIGTAGNAGAKGGDGRYFIDINGTTYNFRNHFANGGNSFGVQNGTTGNYYIGGGAGGYNGSPGGGNTWHPGGLGGGGGVPDNLINGVPNTGSGAMFEGIGGSGIIIIRYKNSVIPFPTTTTPTTYTHQPTTTTTLSTPTLGTPSIELVRGTQGDSNTDYKIGNYNGDFIVKSSVSGVDTDYIRIVGTSASIFNSTASPQWSTVSDRRIKENIEKASYDKCFDTINKLELYRFNYIKELNNNNKDKTQLGYIAQEVNDVFPKAVSSYEFNNTMLSIPDLLSIDVAQINYSLYGAVKKLIEINNNKEVRLKKLESILNIECDSSNVAIVGDTYVSSNIAIVEDIMSSNVVIVEDTYVSSNVAIVEDVMSSNIAIVEDTYVSSNVAIVEDVMSSNVAIVEDTYVSSNIAIVDDVMTSNVVIDDTNNI